MKIILSELQKNYLLSSVLVEKQNILKSIVIKKVNDKFMINLSCEIADLIRDLCGEQLQLVGFDENYKLTEEGKILEVMIDLFFCS